MSNKNDILQVYLALKDCLEDDDDFEKMYNLIQAMASIDAKKAFDMWYPLLSQYENYVTECQPNATYYLTNQNLDVLGEALGYGVFDKMILSDSYLYDLLFKKFCYAGNHYNYTQNMLIRAMSTSNFVLADRMFADIYSNGNNDETWFEIMDGFFFEIKVGDFIPNEPSKKLLIKWASKISEKKEKAKIMSAIIATNQGFDLNALNENSKKESRKSSSNDDLIEIRNSLANLIKEHPESLDNRQILKSMLFDYFPQNKLYVNLLLMAYDEGIVEEIMTSKNIDFLTEHRMKMVLVNNYGIAEDLSETIISTWKTSLNTIGGK